MQVLNDWQIVPIPTVSTVAIEESEYTTTAVATAGNSKRAAVEGTPDTVEELGSNCVCEWYSV